MGRTSIREIEAALSDPSFGIDPYPTYRLLREQGPIYWSETFNAWILSHHDTVDAALRDWQRFSNTHRVTSLLSDFDTPDRARFSPLEEHFASGMVHSDPPDHTRLRRIVGYAFTNRTVQRLRPRIEEIVDDLIDAVEGTDRIELISQLAYPLPVTVIGELFGAPVDDADRFKDWSADLGAFQGTGRSDIGVVERATASIVDMRAYLAHLADRKRAEPGDDLLSALVGQEAEALTEPELLSFCATMLSAGHETTTSLIGNGMLALLHDSDALDRLRSDPDLLESAIEELLRFDAPLQRTWRRVAETTEFLGQTLEQDELVVLFLGAANRDPEVFPDPDRLVLDRSPNRHVALGLGVHFCLGAPLARLEASVAFERLLWRGGAVRLADDDLEWNVNGVFRCLLELPLRFEAGGDG